MPKPGDKASFPNKKGALIKYVWIACPDCGKERWVRAYRAKQLFFTGRCKECSVKFSKEKNWTAQGYLV